MRILSLLPAALLFFAPLLGGGTLLWDQTLTQVLLAFCVALLPVENAGAPSKTLPRSAWVPLAVYGAWSLLFLWHSSYPHSVNRGVLNDWASLSFFVLAATSREEALDFLRSGIALGATAAVAAALPGTAAWMAGGAGPSGTLVNPNVLAAFLALTGPLAVLWWWRKKPWMGAVVLAAVGAVLLAVGSRAAWAAVAVEAALFFALEKRRFWAAPALLLGGAAAFLAVDADRLGWWRSAWAMCAATGFRGVGPGGFGEAYPSFRYVLLGQNTLFAHNFLMESLAERGVVGTAALAAFLGALFLRVSRRFSSAAPVFRAAAVGAAGFLLDGLFHVGFSFPAGAWTFWAMAGILWAGSEPRPRSGVSAPSRRPFLRASAVGAVALSLGAAVFSYRIFQADEFLLRARESLSRGDIPAAYASVQTGLLWNAREPELYSLRAVIKGCCGGDWKAAYADVLRAVFLAPGSARFRAEAGEAALNLGLREEALGHYQEAVRLLPLNKGYGSRLEGLRRGKN